MASELRLVWAMPPTTTAVTKSAAVCVTDARAVAARGLRDIKTTDRNGQVVDVLSVSEDDEVLMITSGGKIQRIRAADISVIGRNTQGVRVIRLDDGDSLVSCALISSGIMEEEAAEAAKSLESAETEVPSDPPADEDATASEPEGDEAAPDAE